MATPAQKQLWDAATAGDLQAVKAALTAGADINAMEEYSGAALHKAASEGHLEVAEYLADNGADLELKDAVDMPPVMKAAVSGQVGVVKLLIAKGAKVSYDLLSSINMKVNILIENSEAGYVRPEAAEAWKGFLEYLVEEYKKQNPQG